MENSRSSRGGAQHKHSGHSRKPYQQRHQRRENNIAHEIVVHSSRRLGSLSRFTLLMLAFFGGGLMTIGAYFGVMLSGGIESTALQYVALSFGVSVGLFMVVSTNSILFTEANVMVPANLYTGSVGQAFARLGSFWIIAFIGNLLGALLVSWIVSHAQGFSSTGAALLKEITQTKLQHKSNGDVFGMLDLVLSGIMANWMIGFSVMYAIFNRAAMGKILIMFVVTAAIVIANFQFFPLNLAYFSLFKAFGDGPSWMQIFVYNLMPVAIGNLIGAGFFVAVPLLLQSQRPSRGRT